MTVYIVDIEAVPTRYTCQWKETIPAALRDLGLDVVVVEGEAAEQTATPGAFLNFSATNIYKSQQVIQLAQLFSNGKVKEGDQFIFTDAWHPGIINLKYMSSLLGIRITTHGLWHAGSYDRWDQLGQRIGDRPWVRHAELSFHDCFDYNWFATDFHATLFAEVLGASELGSFRTGWPFEFLEGTIKADIAGIEKENIVLFPHRIAPEKQVDIFKDLATVFPEWQFIVCQEQQLTKTEYHKLLGKAKIVFSASLQETLGISPVEGMFAGAVPVLPDRLSYSEMYPKKYLYPSVLTSSFNEYKINHTAMIKHLQHVMNNYDSLKVDVANDVKDIAAKFFTATNLFSKVASLANC